MSKTYRHPALKQLKEQQARFAPRSGGWSRSSGPSSFSARSRRRSYPYEYLCFRITGFRPEVARPGARRRRRPARPAAVRGGPLGDGRSEGRAGAEPVLTVDAVSRRFNVSTRTVTRGGGRGWWPAGSSLTAGPRSDSSSRACRGSSRRTATGRSRVTVPATDRRGAGRDRPPRPADGAGSPRPGGLVEIARRIARKMGRSTETVRTTLKPTTASIPTAPFSPTRRRRSTTRPRARSTAALPPGGLGRGSGQPVRPDPVEHLSRDQRDAGAADPEHQARIHAAPELRRPDAQRRDPRPDARAGRRQGTAAAQGPEGLPPYLASLYDVPLLAREQEMHLFRKMNYLKYLAHQLRRRSTQPRARPPTSTRSSGSRKRRWRSRTRSSGPTSAWSSRSPSGTSGRRTTSSSWSPTATCR